MFINVKVKTNSGKQEIKKQGKDFIVYLKSPPENNKANIELLKIMKRYFKRDIKIIKGFKNKNKVLEIKD